MNSYKSLKFTKIYGGPQLTAANHAVYRPIAGNAVGAEQFYARHARIQKMFRARMRVLLELNTKFPVFRLPPVEPPLLRYTLCLPSDVEISKNWQSCNEIRICPFCYARRVHALYNRLLVCIDRENKDDYVLISRRYYYDRICGDRAWLLGFFDSQRDARSRLKKLLCVPGYLTRFNISPNMVGDMLRVSSHHLYLARPGWKVPPALAENAVIKEYRNLSPNTLALAIGRTMEYPKGFLHGNAATTMELLHIAKNLRWQSHTSHGLLRDTAPGTADDC